MRKRISGLMAFVCLLVAAASALAAGTTVTTFTPFADMDFAAQGYMDLITAWEDETGNMVMQGLVQKGYGKLAREICLNHYAQVFEVYKKTGTFWEYYAPESAEPGFMARDNFVGWAGLPPIAELIEFIIGIRGDYAKKQIIWDMNLTEINGIERYPFGPEGLISLKAEARRSASDEPRITVDSNIDFELCVLYGGKEKKINVTSGKHTY